MDEGDNDAPWLDDTSEVFQMSLGHIFPKPFLDGGGIRKGQRDATYNMFRLELKSATPICWNGSDSSPIERVVMEGQLMKAACLPFNWKSVPRKPPTDVNTLFAVQEKWHKKKYPDNSGKGDRETAPFRGGAWDRLTQGNTAVAIKALYGVNRSDMQLGKDLMKDLTSLVRVDMFGNVVSVQAESRSIACFNIEHIFPYSRGGKTHPFNLVAMSIVANSSKASFILNTCISVKVEDDGGVRDRVDFFLNDKKELKLVARTIRWHHISALWRLAKDHNGGKLSDAATMYVFKAFLKIALCTPCMTDTVFPGAFCIRLLEEHCSAYPWIRPARDRFLEVVESIDYKSRRCPVDNMAKTLTPEDVNGISPQKERGQPQLALLEAAQAETEALRRDIEALSRAGQEAFSLRLQVEAMRGEIDALASANAGDANAGDANAGDGAAAMTTTADAAQILALEQQQGALVAAEAEVARLKTASIVLYKQEQRARREQGPRFDVNGNARAGTLGPLNNPPRIQLPQQQQQQQLPHQHVWTMRQNRVFPIMQPQLQQLQQPQQPQYTMPRYEAAHAPDAKQRGRWYALLPCMS
jgi:hypothetical protein